MCVRCVGLAERDGMLHLPTEAKRQRQNTGFNIPGKSMMVSDLEVEVCAGLSQREGKTSSNVEPPG